MLCFEIPRDHNPDLPGKEKELLPAGILLGGTADEPLLEVGTEDGLKSIPFDDKLLQARNEVMGLNEDPPQIVELADLVFRGKDEEAHPVLVEQRHPRDNRALVKLDLALQPGRISELHLMLNVHEEEFVPGDPYGSVVRVQKPWGGEHGLAPKGIGTMVEGHRVIHRKNHNDEFTETVPVLLLELSKGASFQIHRDQRITIPRIIISWDGSSLRWVVPGKYRNRQRR